MFSDFIAVLALLFIALSEGARAVWPWLLLLVMVVIGLSVAVSYFIYLGMQ